MKAYIIIAFLLSPVVLLAQKSDFNIKGTLAAYPPSSKVFLYYKTNGHSMQDSTILQNGRFGFSGTVSSPVLASIIIKRDGQDAHTPISLMLQCYLEQGAININSSDSLPDAVVTGTPLNKDNELLKSQLKPAAEKMRIINAGWKALPNKEEQEAYIKKMNGEIAALSGEQKTIRKQFIAQHPHSLVSLDAIRSISSPYPDVDLVDSLFQLLSPDLQHSDAGKLYAIEIGKLKMTAIGSPAPEFAEKDTAGLSISLRSFRGHYVLIDFWASWCVPCRAENPNVLKAYNTYKAKNFTVLGVSLERPEDRQKWIKAIRDDNMPWTQVSDLNSFQGTAATLYNINAIPQNFLVDPDGKIIAKNLRGDKLEMLSQYIK